MNKDEKYSSKIIMAPALINDAKVFLTRWNDKLSIEDNIKRAYLDNIFGKASRSYVKHILTAFKERFIFGDEKDLAIRKLVCYNTEASIVDRILYYHTALADRLLYDFVIEYLYNLKSLGQLHITTNEAETYIRSQSDKGKTTTKWTNNVCNRVARNILASIRDFHILEGASKKRIAPVYVPIEVFVYVAFLIKKEVASGEKIINHKNWRLFLLDTATVEKLFLESHQQGFLSYESAGNIIRIDFKQNSLMEVVDAII
jgi:hypothetical protein